MGGAISGFILGALTVLVLMFVVGGIVIIQMGGDIIVQDLAHPTMEELVDFLARDKTELLRANVFVGDWHRRWLPICVDFAITLRTNATRVGWDFDVVILNFQEGIGHAMNGVKVRSENGFEYYFVEPQNDRIMPPLKVGDKYEIGGENFTVSYVGIID